MSDVILIVVVLLVSYVGIPVAIFFFVRHIRKSFRRPSQHEVEENSRQFLEQLQKPNFAALEQHFGHSFSTALKSLYANQKELLRGEFQVAESIDAEDDERWYIAFYLPANEETLKSMWPGLEKYFAFADDGCGDEFLVDPTLDDPPVLFHDHETGEIEKVCDQFSEFMAWPRRESTA